MVRFSFIFHSFNIPVIVQCFLNSKLIRVIGPSPDKMVSDVTETLFIHLFTSVVKIV